MKRLTLVSILMFLSIVGAIFIGNIISANEHLAQPPNFKNASEKSAKYQVINNSPGSKVGHFNDLNLNTSQLKFSTGTSSADTFTVDKVARHNNRNDCYLIISNKVYDVSSYISYHPGGSRVITSRCGKEVTGIFARIHSNRAWDLLKKYKVGTITTNQLSTEPLVLNAIEKALKDANPGVDVIKVAPKKDFYIAKLIFNNRFYEVHINSSGKIIKEEVADEESNWNLWQKDSDDKR